MKIKILIATIFLTTGFILTQSQNPELKTRYSFPATVWESEALPLGNGNIGMMIFGDVSVDVIQVNEHSLWSGGPGKNPNYNGGHSGTAAQNRQTLQRVRTALQDKMTAFSANNVVKIDATGKVTAGDYSTESASLKSDIEALMGNKTDFGAYQSISNINIAYNSAVIPEIINITGDCNNPNTAGERFPSLFDGSASTKWFSDTGFKGFPCYIAWEYQNPFTVSSYTLTSGNDMQARDPKSWNLYGSTDGSSYTLIDARSNITFSSRNQNIKFDLSKTETYKYFKFEITATYTTNTPPQLSEIYMENAGTSQFPASSNYSRELNIDNAISKVTYLQEGVNYTREYFVSHPDNVIVIHLSADKPGKISRTVYFTSPQTKISINVSNNVITMEGSPADHGANGLKFAQQIKVIPTGGTLTKSGSKITVENADELLIISSAATNYIQ
jgi:enamine deaminase RidA (YjgF/YER057c/UK114 family)